jgi:hypothetical protein
MDLDTASPKKDAAIREVQRHDSPEGAPPPKRTRQRTWMIVSILFAALAIATVAVLFLIDGATAVAVGIAVFFGYLVFGAAEAWLATGQRVKERHEIKEQVERRP